MTLRSTKTLLNPVPVTNHRHARKDRAREKEGRKWTLFCALDLKDLTVLEHFKAVFALHVLGVFSSDHLSTFSQFGGASK